MRLAVFLWQNLRRLQPTDDGKPLTLVNGRYAYNRSFFLALRSVSANRLRAGLTVTVIAFGIMALVSILTVIDALQYKIYDSFASMGANGFSIRNREMRIRMGNGEGRLKEIPPGRAAGYVHPTRTRSSPSAKRWNSKNATISRLPWGSCSAPVEG